MASRPMHDRVYQAGEPAPRSGIYLVTHDGHREDHTVTAIRGEPFPPCRKCKQQVRFRLVADAEYVVHDWDLAGPQGMFIVKE